MPFSIRCVSCHGRLRVTDEALVNTIVACPRCGSMVQIAAPEKIEPQPPMVVGSESVDSEELTRSELFDENDLPPLARDNGTFASSASAGAPPVERASGEQHEQAPPVQTPAPETAATPGEAATPEADWQDSANWSSQHTQKFRRRWLAGIAGVAGLVVAGLLLAWALNGSGEAERLADVDNAGSPVNVDPSFVPEPVVPAENRDADSLASNGETETTIEPATVATSDPSMIPADLLPTDMFGEPLTGANPLAEPDSKQPDKGVAVDPSGGPIVPTPAESPVAEPLLDMPAELQAFVQLLGLPGEAPDAPPVQNVVKPAGDLILDEAADAMIDPMLLATATPDINIDNALKLRIALQTDGYPLASLTLFCSELTQVPIQIDWVTLDLAGISISQIVKNTEPGWKTVDALLQMIGTETGVLIERQETKLFVTLNEAETVRRLQEINATDDFGDEQASAKSLIDRIVAQAPWSERERAGLRALATDNLRRARELPIKLPEATLSHWSARAGVLQIDAPEKDSFPELWPLLTDGDSGPQLDTSITLAGLLRQTSRLNQTSCVVNWDDVLLRRLTPGQLVLPYADQSAGQMLARTLAPMALQIRAADEGHWWVGTAATYDRMPVFVVGDECGPQRDAIIARIGNVAAIADATLLIEHDPVSDRYLCLMPRFLYRQLPAVLAEFR